jgi:DNA repair exonuclease SbcCD nuclease subunit
MRVAHVSDLHLGHASPGDPHGAERLSSFRHAVAALAALDPDVLVVAGDTFHTPDVEASIVEETARILSGARNTSAEPIPVILIPGNHDPDDATLWTAFRKSLGASAVHVVLTPTVVPLHDGKLIVEAYPCPTRFSAAAPWETRLELPADSAAVHVVVAHGTLQGGPVPEGETDAYPFTLAEVEGLGADYVALGHFHGVYPAWTGGDEIERSVCYCGTHEPDQFSGDAGYATIAEIAKGRPTRLRRIKVGRRQWRLLEITGPADLARLEQLRNEIGASEHPGRFVIRLRIESRTSWPADKIEHFTRLENALRTLGAQMERKGDLQARLDSATLDLANLPSGAVKEALLAIQAEFEGAGESEREVRAAALQIGWEKFQEAVES